MKKIMTLVCLGASMIASSGAVWAGNQPGDITLSVSGAYYAFAGKRYMENTGMPLGAVTYNFNERYAVEGAFGIINTQTKDTNINPEVGAHGYLYMLDGLYRFTPRGHFEPYIIAGVGALGLRPNGYNPSYQGNVNAGFGTQFFIDRGIAFRAEARDLYTMAGGKNDAFVSLGISFLFDCPKVAAVDDSAATMEVAETKE